MRLAHIFIKKKVEFAYLELYIHSKYSLLFNFNYNFYLVEYAKTVGVCMWIFLFDFLLRLLTWSVIMFDFLIIEYDS